MYLLQTEQICPKFTCFRVKEVNVRRVAGPAITLEVLFVVRFDKEFLNVTLKEHYNHSNLSLSVLIYIIFNILTNVGIHDGY